MHWQIATPIILALLAYAHFRKALTPSGVLAALFTAVVHAWHPWNLPFVLLCVFFLTGTRVTKLKQAYKATLTMSSKGSPGEGPRTHTQVFANSIVATSLTWMHANQLRNREKMLLSPDNEATGTFCYSWAGDLLPVGIIACYAAAAADTFSSELGILARSEPRLITDSKFRKVPRGTNGGVTIEGLAAGLLGSILVVTPAMFFLPTCDETTAGAVGGGVPWTAQQRAYFMIGLSLWGLVGSVFDSWLGAVFQRTVKDTRTGKVVEGEGGNRALISGEEPHLSKRGAAREVVFTGEGKGTIEHPDASITTAIDDETSHESPRQRYDPKNKARTSSFGDAQPTRVVENGWDILDNNDVNFLMTVFMSMTAMALASQTWGVPFANLQAA